MTAAELGHEYLALTDHSPLVRVAGGLDAGRLAEQLDVVAALNEEVAPFRILAGMEVDILEDGSLDMESELLGRLDVVVASVHSKLDMEAGAMTKRMVTALANPHVDILGHCTGRLVVGRGRNRGLAERDCQPVSRSLPLGGSIGTSDYGLIVSFCQGDGVAKAFIDLSDDQTQRCT